MSNLVLVEVKPGQRWPVEALRKMLKSPAWVVQFAAIQDLNPEQLSSLLRLLFPGTDIVQALTMEAGSHSGHLQHYIVSLGYEYLLENGRILPDTDPAPTRDERLLAVMFERLQVQVAESIVELADQVADAMAHMPGKKGRMQIRTLLKQDRRIKKLGVAETLVEHGHEPDNLIIFDCSGSMGEHTVTRIVTAVKALAVEANAHLVIVSNTARHWNPGEFTVDAVLEEAEYGGTHYETLAGLFDNGQKWGVVVTIADYDSSWSAKEALSSCTGTIEVLLDISLVDRPTFLAECLEPLAKEVRPLMVANRCLTYDY